MIDKDIKKLVRELRKQGFALDQRKSGSVLVAPDGARMALPTGNNNRLGVTFVRKFAAKHGGRL